MAGNKTLWTPAEASEELGVSVRTLGKWRSDKSVRLPYVKIGRCARYRRSDIEVYIEQNSHNVEG